MDTKTCKSTKSSPVQFIQKECGASMTCNAMKSGAGKINMAYNGLWGNALS